MPSLRTLLVPTVLFTQLGRAADDTPAFHVASETTLVRRLESRYTMQLDSMVLTMDGEEVPAEFLGEFQIDMEHEETCVLTDTFGTVAAGRPDRLRRTFDELSGSEHVRFSSEAGEENDEKEYESELEGKCVVFSWNEDAQGFDSAFEGASEGDVDLLEALDEDMDLRRFLPEESVEVGDTWQIDAKALGCVLDPGGDLALREKGVETDDTSATDSQLRANMSGTITATYRALETGDGRRIALIRLEVETDTHSEETLSAEEVPEGGQGTGRVESEFVLEGELRWDLEHGHALALELDGRTELTMTETVSGEFEGEEVEQSQVMVFTGEMTFAMQFERR